MIPTGITAAFEMIEAQLALEIAILHFDRPAAARDADQGLQGRGRRQIAEVVLSLAVDQRFLTEQPALAATLRNVHAHRSEAGLAMWRQGMKALAACPQVYCKLSCLCLRDGAWDYEDTRRVVLETIEMFGVQRCMFASNFPVDGLRVGFDTMFPDFKRMTQELSTAERQALFHDNAARFYRL